MYGGAGAIEEDRSGGLTAPSARGVLLGGLPAFLRESLLPLAAFYTGFRLWGPAAGIGCSTAASALVYLHERRAGREGLLVRLTLAFVLVRALIGLLAHSTTAYLAVPVLANAVWGVAFVASVAVGRPLAGALARAWYPFGPEFRRTALFRRVFAVESLVWGLFLLGIAAVRAAALVEEGVGGFVVVSVVTGTPATLVLIAWSVWYARERLGD